MYIYATKEYQAFQNLLISKNKKFFVIIKDGNNIPIPLGNADMHTAQSWINEMVQDHIGG